MQRHPFVDGNKRTGTAGAVYMLRRAGYKHKGVSNKELVKLALSVAAHRVDTEELGRWFEHHTETLRQCALRFWRDLKTPGQ